MKIPDIILDKTWTRILGVYLLCIVSFQVFVYLQIENIGNIFIYDPRIGLHAMLEMLFHGKMEMPEMMLIEWLTAAWLGCIAVLMVLGKSLIRTYVISESILFILNVVIVAILICENCGFLDEFPAHIIRAALVMMIPATIIPFLLIAARASIIRGAIQRLR